MDISFQNQPNIKKSISINQLFQKSYSQIGKKVGPELNKEQRLPKTIQQQKSTHFSTLNTLYDDHDKLVQKQLSFGNELVEAPISEIKLCRVCLETSGSYIQPCKCTGNRKYVHIECLQEFILSQYKHQYRQAYCALCKKRYKQQIKSKKVFMPQFGWQHTKEKGVCLFILFIFLLLLSIEIALLVFIIKNNNTIFKDSILLIGFFIFCFIILLLLIWCLKIIMKDMFFIEKIESWDIFNYNELKRKALLKSTYLKPVNVMIDENGKLRINGNQKLINKKNQNSDEKKSLDHEDKQEKTEKKNNQQFRENQKEDQNLQLETRRIQFMQNKRISVSTYNLKMENLQDDQTNKNKNRKKLGRKQQTGLGIKKVFAEDKK